MVVGLSPASVVLGFDVFHSRCPGGHVIDKIIAVVHPGLHMQEERLGLISIPTHPDLTHGLGEVVASAPFLEITGGVLRYSVAIENSAVWMKLVMVRGHDDRINDQFGAHVRRHRPASFLAQSRFLWRAPAVIRRSGNIQLLAHAGKFEVGLLLPNKRQVIVDCCFAAKNALISPRNSIFLFSSAFSVCNSLNFVHSTLPDSSPKLPSALPSTSLLRSPRRNHWPRLLSQATRPGGGRKSTVQESRR